MSEIRTGRIDAGFIGTPAALEFIANLEWPGFDELEDLQRFLGGNQVTESMATAIHEYATPKPGGYPQPTIESGDFHDRATGWFVAMIESPGLQRRIGVGDDVTAIRIHGQRQNHGGLFDYQYNLALPVDKHMRLDCVIAEPEAWYKTDQKEEGYPFNDPAKQEPGSLDLVVKLVQEASAEMAQVIEDIQERREMAQAIGKKATEELAKIT